MPCRTIGYNTFMLYIITALSAEARPIINHFRLKKVENTLPYPLFSAENVHLLLTQVGYENSALYRATRTGLRAFGQSLFEEVRKDGVNVLTINPYMTDTAFFDDLHFGVSDKEDEKLLASDIADIVEEVLKMRPGSAVTEVTVRAQKFGITKKKKK